MRGIILVYCVLLTLCVQVAFCAGPQVIRKMTDAVQPGSLVEIEYQIEGLTKDVVFTLEDEAQSPITFINWTVEGAAEAKGNISIRSKDHSLAWSFTPTGSSATIGTVVDIPDNTSIGNYTFSAVWFDSSGFSNNKSLLEVITPAGNISQGNQTNSTKTVKKVVKTTANKKKILNPQQATGGSIVWPSLPALDAYTAWGIGFFVISFMLVILLAYFFQKTNK